MPTYFGPVDLAFRRLDALLHFHPLPTEGGERFASAGEFMLMNPPDADVLEFKHRHSRNYLLVHLLIDGSTHLSIPRSNANPWFGGLFDYRPHEPAGWDTV